MGYLKESVERQKKAVKPDRMQKHKGGGRRKDRQKSR
jgi:hypothetical protein